MAFTASSPTDPKHFPSIPGKRKGFLGPNLTLGQVLGCSRCCFEAMGMSHQEAANWPFPIGKVDRFQE